MFSLDFGIKDYFSKNVKAVITGLPKGAKFDGKKLIWVPAKDQAGKTYYMTIQLTNSSNYTWTEDFSVFVNHFSNGNLITDNMSKEIPSVSGWTKEGTAALVCEYKQPFYQYTARLVGLKQENSWGSLKQTVDVKTNVDYVLAFKGINELVLNHDKAYVQIDELGLRIPFTLNEKHFDYSTLSFNSGKNSKLTISIHAGDSDNLCSGKLFVTSFRLTPKH